MTACSPRCQGFPAHLGVGPGGSMHLHPPQRGSREAAGGSASVTRRCNEREINSALITHCLFLQFHLGLQPQWGKKTKKNGIKKARKPSTLNTHPL